MKKMLIFLLGCLFISQNFTMQAASEEEKALKAQKAAVIVRRDKLISEFRDLAFGFEMMPGGQVKDVVATRMNSLEGAIRECDLKAEDLKNRIEALRSQQIASGAKALVGLSSSSAAAAAASSSSSSAASSASQGGALDVRASVSVGRTASEDLAIGFFSALSQPVQPVMAGSKRGLDEESEDETTQQARIDDRSESGAAASASSSLTTTPAALRPSLAALGRAIVALEQESLFQAAGSKRGRDEESEDDVRILSREELRQLREQRCSEETAKRARKEFDDQGRS